jgi:DNA-binding NtrC family response regulator
MGESYVDIRILLVDNDEVFATAIQRLLNERSNGTRFILDWQTPNAINLDSGYDVFIFDMNAFGFDQLSGMIGQAQKLNENGKIILVGEMLDGHLIKKLMRMGIKSFAEKIEEDIDVIFGELQEEAEMKYRYSRIKDGIKTLSIEQAKMNNILRGF